MTTGRGRGCWVWQIPQCEKGDVAAIVAKAKSVGVDRLLIKVADGTTLHKANKNLYAPLVAAAKKAGLEAWVWQYAYSAQPVNEAAFAAGIAYAVGADCFVIDAEKEYANKPAAARAYTDTLKTHLGGIPIGFSSYYLPSLHAEMPWDVFCKAADFIMPQVYWYNRDPAWAVTNSINSFTRYDKPIIPSLAAYPWKKRHTTAEMEAAVKQCNALRVRGFDWWDWQHITPDRWQVVKSAALAGDLRVVGPDGKVILCNVAIERGITRVNLRQIVESLGHTVTDEIRELGRITIH